MRRFSSVRAERRVVVGFGLVGLLLAVVLVSGLNRGPAPHPSASAGPTSSPTITAGATSAPLPTAVVMAAPTEYLPECAASPAGDPVKAAAAPIAGGVTFETIGRLGGPVSAVEVLGRHAYVAAGATVQVIDLDGPDGAAIITTVGVPAYATDLALEGETLAVAAGEAGLVLLDLADPVRPSVADAIPLPGYAEGVDLAGSLAVVADGPGGVRILDLAEPRPPASVGVVIDHHQVFDVAVAGSLAYVAAADEGLIVIDLANPAKPRVLGALETGGYAYGVAIDGPTAYLADGWGGVAMIDVQDAAAPRLAQTFDTGSWALGVDAADGVAYVAAGGEGLVVIDPTTAAVTGRVADPASRAVDVAISDELAYVADARVGLLEIDVTNLGQLAVRRSIAVLAEVHDARPAPDGDGLLLASGSGGLWQVDGNAPAVLQPGENIGTSLVLQDVVAVGENVVTTGGGGQDGPEHGVLAATVGPSGMTPSGTYLLGAPDFSGWNPASRPSMHGRLVFFALEVGLLIVDAGSTPPCLVGRLRTQEHRELEIGYVGGVALAGDVAYLGANEDGIFVVDVSDPESPRLVRRVPVTAYVGVAITAAGSSLYAVDGSRLVTYDLADPRNPRLLGSVELPFETTLLTYADGRLFLASQTAILAVDVSNPKRPRLAGRHEVPGRILRLTAADGLLYAALGADGLAIVSWQPGKAAGIRRSEPLADRFDRPTPIGSLDGDRAAALAVLDLPDRPSIPVSRSCVVGVVDDVSPNSLRGCLGQAGAGTRITFDPAVFPTGAPGVIEPGSELEVPRGVTIDATGAGVVLDGLGQVATGLVVEGGAALIGLQVRNFAEVGVSIGGDGSVVSGNVVGANGYAGIGIGGEGNWVSGNRIGTDPSGTRPAGLQNAGVLVEGSRNVIGGPRAEDSNLISGNQFGVDLLGQDNVVAGNLIGTDRTGRHVIPKAVQATDGAGIGIRSGGHVVAGNLLASTMEIVDFAAFNTIIGNRIGVDREGRPFPCECGLGVFTPFNRIGGSRPGEGNVIRGHLGIISRDAVVLGNSLAWDGPVGIEGSGVHNVIGGRAAHAGNLITAIDGVTLADGARLNVIIGNRWRVTRFEVRYDGPWPNYVVANVDDR